MEVDKTSQKRSYRRRSEEELIEELEAKIREVEARKERKKAKESPILQDFSRLKKHMSKFAQACMDKGRSDVANTVMGFMSILEKQSKELSDAGS